MWKTKGLTVLIIVVLIFISRHGGYFLFGDDISAKQSYLPRADLIKGEGPRVYLLENGVRRWIPSPEVFESFGFKWSNIKNVSEAVLQLYPQGDDLSKYDDYPEGALLKGSGPKVYLIELGRRRWIPSPRVFEANGFGWRYIINVDDKKLERIEDGDNLGFSEPQKYPDTFVLEGPADGETLETTEVTFKFSGANPLGPVKDLSFETFLSGYDSKWHRTFGDAVTYRLPEGGNRAYLFYVRAKNKQGYIDPSPALISFQIGVSPYYQKVQIKRIKPNASSFRKDYLILENTSQEPIGIDNWTIKTRLEEVIIPQAISKLKHPFSTEDYSSLNLAPNEEAIISTGLSPIGVNFRTNQCTGYLSQDSRFFPSLDKDCPRLDESEYRHFKKTCRDFIEDLDRCEVPDYSGRLEIQSDGECTLFLTQKFNYKQCYLDHYREVNFFGEEWRIFLNKSVDVFGNDSDEIILKDRNGLVVDRYSY